MSGIAPDWLHLRWPHEVTVDQVEAALRGLNGLTTRRRRDALVLQAIATKAGVAHYLALPSVRRDAVIHGLRQAIPGLLIEAIDQPTQTWNSQWIIWISTRRRPLRTTEPEALARSLITALSGVHGTEALALTWTLGPVRRPIAVPSKAHSGHGDAWQQYLPIGITELDTDARTALVKKQAEPGWRVAGRLAVRAATKERQLQLLGRVSGALRSAQGSGVQIGAHRSLWPSTRLLPWRRPLALNVNELVGLAAWPMGRLDDLPIERLASRVVPPVRAVPSTGRIIGDASYPGQVRPIALSVKDSLSHTWLCGPTGAGKSTLLARLVETDFVAGRAVVVIDPKGDLIELVLARVPERRRDDVVVLDPADDARPVGFNPLRHARRNPELIADRLLGLFRGLSGDAWGPRIADVLHASLLTIAQAPDSNLCLLPLLLSDPGYRRQIIQRLDDPFGLGPFWASFDALSDNERQQAIAPVMRRLRQLLLRPRMRAVLGQTHPTFDLSQVFTERKMLLVSLAKGLLGPEASALLGSLIVSQLWQTILGRANVAPERRHPVMVFIDEVQDQVHGVTDLGDMLAQARSLGIGLHLAHQHLGQLDTGLRSALSANARSRIVFQTASDDASFFARGQTVLRPEDFQRLPRHEAYVSLLADGHVTPYASVRLRPPTAGSADPETLRARSREQYGVNRETVERELRALIAPNGKHRNRPLGVRRTS